MDQSLTDFLWSKLHPRESLFGHLRETATVMNCFLENSSYSDDRRLLAGWLGLTEKDTLALCQYLAAMHDIGKCHPLFQGKEPEMDEYLRAKQLVFPLTDSYRHESGSKAVAIRIWRFEKRFDKEVRRSFSYFLSLHHQGKKCEGQCLKLGNR